MRLAEALILRADVQKRYNQVKSRLSANARVQEGDTPPEKPEELLRELEQLLKEQGSLVRRINRTNCAVAFDEKRTIADALADRDILAQHRHALTELIESASVRQDRFTRTELRYVSTVDIATLQRQADQLAKEYRELDIRLQELNWSTELVD